MPYTFCPKCGYHVEWAPTCSKCGAQLPPGGSQPVVSVTTDIPSTTHPTVSPASSPPVGRSGLAIAALVLGILGFLVGVLSIGAIICGVLGMSRTGDGKMRGRGMAKAGLVLGCVGLVCWLLVLYYEYYK